MTLYTHPFWFLPDELLESLWRAEVNTLARLLENTPDPRKLFDTPDLPIAKRRACFNLLAHRWLLDELDEAANRRYQDISSTDQEIQIIRKTNYLFQDDAPSWVQEMNAVVKNLPHRMIEAMPEALQTEGCDPDDANRIHAIRAATITLNTVATLQHLAETVFKQQLLRLEKRWPSKRINKRKGWEQRENLYRAIREIMSRNPSPEGIEFCAELDRRHAKPLADWIESGEWEEGVTTFKTAWRKTALRRKIRRVRHEVMRTL